MGNKEKRLEVRPVQDTATHVPWGVCMGRMVVARFATEPEAEACRVRLQLKIDRGAVLDVVARVRSAIES